MVELIVKVIPVKYGRELTLTHYKRKKERKEGRKARIGEITSQNDLKLIMVFVFQKKCSSLGGVAYTSSPFYGQSILTFNFASCSFGPFFLSSSLQLIAYSIVSLVSIFMQQKFAYDVGPDSTYSAH